MFFVRIEVAPTASCSQMELVQGAFAHCWVVADSEESAYNKASYYVRRDGWEITHSTHPVEVNDENVEATDLWCEQVAKAIAQSLAIYYVAWSRDGQTTLGPFPLPQRRNLSDLDAHLQGQKKLTTTGRCLHFDCPVGCNDLVLAHSLQRAGLLREISRNGHVYVPSPNINSMRKNHGKLAMEQQGTSKVSTFRGFCGHHDSLLFKPIDTAPLVPTDEQVALYAYRALCRELLLKENSSNLIDAEIAKAARDGGTAQFFDELRRGTDVGLTNARRHKTCFDESLRRRSFQDVEYTLFAFSQTPFLAFSAVFYPEYDFLGRKLQNLADSSTPLDLIALCSAQMQDGWGLLLAWHKTSTTVCSPFLGSLAAIVQQRDSAEEALFRLVFASCENVAIAPSWWEALSDDSRNRICSALTPDLFGPTRPDYVASSLDGISKWTIDRVLARGNR